MQFFLQPFHRMFFLDNINIQYPHAANERVPLPWLFLFAGLTYLSLFLAGQMRVLRPHADLARCLVAGAPLLGAALIAISRCEDYRHDVYDVTCGALLGFGIAWFCYRRHYPRLRAMWCDEPFAAPAVGKDGRVKDEEARIAGAREYEIGDGDSDADA